MASSGNRLLGQHKGNVRGGRSFTGPVEFRQGVSRCDYTEIFEEFLADAGATLPTPWSTEDTSAAGAPTLDYVTDTDNGTYALITAANDEAEYLTLYWEDCLMVDATAGPIFEARLKINTDAATFSADQRMVIGLCGDRNDTLDNVAAHAWFRVEGANLNILWETDDGTTDDDDNDTTIDYVKNTYFRVLIDMTSLSQIEFWVDKEDGAGWQHGGTGAAAVMTGNLQPIVEQQKDGGTETDEVHIDYIRVAWERS